MQNVFKQIPQNINKFLKSCTRIWK